MPPDLLPDTPDLSRPYCPGCEPNADPSSEILKVKRCEKHLLDESGADDEKVYPDISIYSQTLSDAEMNRGFADLLHRGKLSTQ